MLDGATYAFTDLTVEGKGLRTLGDRINDYEHLRNLNVNNNRFENVDKLRALKYMQTLTACNNEIIDNYFMSESKQQLKFLTQVDMSGNKLTKLR